MLSYYKQAKFKQKNSSFNLSQYYNFMHMHKNQQISQLNQQTHPTAINYYMNPQPIFKIIDIIIIMGQSDSIENLISNRWQIIDTTNKHFDIVRDKSGREGEQYRIQMPSLEYPQHELNIYQLRKITPHPIVRVYGAEYRKTTSLCSSSYSLRIITQRLCLRIDQALILNAQQVMYLLLEAAEGYRFLYEKVGCFKIKPDMMGLTSEGELRVWLHHNFAFNKPEFPKNSVETVRISAFKGRNAEQIFLVGQILQIFSKFGQNKGMSSTFGNLLNWATTFQQLITAIQTARKRGTPIARRVDILRNKHLLKLY